MNKKIKAKNKNKKENLKKVALVLISTINKYETHFEKKNNQFVKKPTLSSSENNSIYSNPKGNEVTALRVITLREKQCKLNTSSIIP